MKVKVVNSSSRKTREKIKKAFAQLMKEKQDLNKITVTSLVLKLLVVHFILIMIIFMMLHVRYMMMF